MPAQLSIKATVVTCCLASLNVLAQVPNDTRLQDEMKKQQKRSADAVNQVVPGMATQSMPNFATPSAPGPDPAEIVKRYEGMKQAVAAKKEEGLIVFISLGMPAESLNKLIDQSAKYKFPLIIRGMQNDDWKLTLKTIQNLIGKRQAEIQIDPRLFTRFNIGVVPSVVVVSPNNEKWGVVEGDVTVDYALETMTKSMPDVAAYAATQIKRFRP